MLSNEDIMKEARMALKGHWHLSVGVSALYLLFHIFTEGSGEEVWFSIFSSIVGLVFYGVFEFGFARFWLNITRQNSVSVQNIFQGFSEFVKLSIAGILLFLFVILWSLLFIVPGVIAICSYSMTFFIMNDDPKLSPREAIARSKHLMYGYKWKLFCLTFRFIGWFFLSLITLGIGFLWFIPYFSASIARFYDAVKETAAADNASEASEAPEAAPLGGDFS